MRVYRTSYRDKKTGASRQAAKWYIELRDHLSIVRRFPGFTDKRATEALGRQIERLVATKIAGEQPDREQSVWLEQIPAKLRERLASIGLISVERGAAGKSLAKHLDDFKQSLQDKNNTVEYVRLVVSRVRRVFDGCGFISWGDVAAQRVERYLAELRDKGDGLSIQTSNYYLQSVKSFCLWMVRSRRASESPLAHLRPLNARTDRRRQRRALDADELVLLVSDTRDAATRFGMSGRERALCYTLAVETGLRANEIRSLTSESFDFTLCEVTIQAGSSKRRRTDILPVRSGTAAQMRDLLNGKLPGAAAFNLPSKFNMAKMLRCDLADAGVTGLDDVDFHSLRHSTASLLAAAGVNPKTAQEIMRHSDINLTMSRYSHTYRGATADAVAKLPDFSKPSREQQRAVATGTDGPIMDGKNPENDLASCLALRGGSGGISADADGQPEHQKTDDRTGKKNALADRKDCFSAVDDGNIPARARSSAGIEQRISNP